MLRRGILGIAATALLALLTAPTATAASLVDGRATASSFQLDEAPALDAKAYLVGFNVGNGTEEEASYRWSFQAERVEVVLDRRSYINDFLGIEQNRTIERPVHADAAGTLLRGLPLSYMMAVSAAPDDVGTGFGLRLGVPFDTLAPRGEISFTTDRLSEDDGTPLEDVAALEDSRNREYRRPWLNLETNLDGHQDPLVLQGDFAVSLFDMEFEVSDPRGTTHYSATFGGARGDDVPSPLHQYNDTYAELRFTNATFTFLPAGRPMQVNLLSAGVQTAGKVYMTDARGALKDDTGIEKALDGSLVELDAQDLRLDVQAGAQTPPQYRLAFKGLVDGAVVDGRLLDLLLAGPPTEEGSPPSTVGTSPSSGRAGLAWSLLTAAALLGAAAAAWWLRRSRLDVDALIQDAKLAMDDRKSTRAKRLLGRILRRDPHNETAAVMTARLSLERNRPHEALDFLEARVGGPADRYGGVSLAYCAALRDVGELDEARRVMDDLKRRIPLMAGMEKLLFAKHDGDMTYA